MFKDGLISRVTSPLNQLIHRVTLSFTWCIEKKTLQRKKIREADLPNEVIIDHSFSIKLQLLYGERPTGNINSPFFMVLNKLNLFLSIR